MNREKYFIDLSKLSQEQIKALPQKFEKAGHKILSETLSDLISGKITDGFKFLFYSPSGWNQNDYPLNGRTELTYSQFLDMMGESEEKSKVIENIEKELINNDGTLYIGEGLENYYKDQLERTGKYSVISKEVLQAENYTREDIEKAYQAGENKQTYYFKDTTVILPTTYEGVDG